MRYPDVDTSTRISKIGLGTWQSGRRSGATETVTPGRSAGRAGRGAAGCGSANRLGTRLPPFAAEAVAAAHIDLSDDEQAALSAAYDRFRPVTGRAANPAVVRARLRR